jgi:CRP-like cAMP-binding protein
MTAKYKQIFNLVVGEYFGEIALMQKDSLRTCTVRSAIDDTQLLEVDKQAFDSFVGEYKTESVKTIIDFYKACKLFSLIPDQKKVELAAKSFMIKYPTNTVILRQDDIPFNIYFIATGTCRLVRRLSSPDDPIHIGLRGKLYQIDILQQGRSFADYELFKQKDMLNSVITMCPTTIIYVPYFSVIERLTSTDLVKMKSCSHKMLSDKAVLNSYQENSLWTNFKANLVKSVLPSVANKLPVLSEPDHVKKLNLVHSMNRLLPLIAPQGAIGNKFRNTDRLRFPSIPKPKQRKPAEKIPGLGNTYSPAKRARRMIDLLEPTSPSFMKDPTELAMLELNKLSRRDFQRPMVMLDGIGISTPLLKSK